MTPTQAIARRMELMRRGRGWTAQRLAEAMKAVGIPWDRQVISKLENNRRNTVTVDELFGLAYCLETSPVHVVIPAGDADDGSPYRPVPAIETTPAVARAWIRGFGVLPGISEHKFFAEADKSDPEWVNVDQMTRLAPALRPLWEQTRRAAAETGVSLETIIKFLRFMDLVPVEEGADGEH